MISFANDYLEGAHPRILEALTKTNMIQEYGYGNDNFSKQAENEIKRVIDCKDATVKFLTGGTQTNQVVINTMLRKYDGVLATDISHIATHEAGAIEFSGHKVLTLPSYNGKIKAEDVDNYIIDFYNDEAYTHMVFPGMVCITYPTEYGTLYSKDELESISKVCKKHNIPLYCDGARLGYGLMSKEADVTIKDIAKFCDAFYIGGTKIGALCGEALVFTSNNQPEYFETLIKQHGALVAKGRLHGIQFFELFKDNLYFEISEYAVKLAEKLKKGFVDKGYKLFIDSPTNQQFFIVDNKKIKELEKKFNFAKWEKYDEEHTVIRFVTSWATLEENIDELLKLI